MSQANESQDVLAGRGVILGVSGGIAAFKACSLVTDLRKRGARVRVVMTENATHFVGTTTFAALSGNAVAVQLFVDSRGDELEHIHLQDFGEVFAVVPASANILGKVAGGIADDMLSTAIMAARCPVIFAPAMNKQMWASPAVRGNVERLGNWGYRFVMPEEGRLASGAEGAGRLAPVETILAEIEYALAAGVGGADLAGRRVVVTAGPTREHLDPVRFLSNPSTGRMGYALAAEAARRGAAVTLVSGPTEITAPANVTLHRVTTTQQMLEAVLATAAGADLYISAAAPADFLFAENSETKIGRKDGALQVTLQPTPDILEALTQKGRPRVMVGFAAETGNALSGGRAKLQRKNLDMLVANDVSEPGSGFAVDTNRVIILHSDGSERALPLMSKHAVASVIIDECAAILNKETVQGDS